ncbi:MAG: peptidoglycan DD-metalloendopeptidase family protein [Crocinitomicaceae bacterium]|nr:peptidoglycan DD-metalloendopeptidase family protein [Crocinitomicaceae bacterium]
MNVKTLVLIFRIRMLNVTRSLLLFLFCVFSFAAVSQQKDSDRLKKEQEELKKKIGFTEKLLESTKTNKQNLTENIGLIERKIEYRDELLNNLDKQLSQLSMEIESMKEEIESLRLEIERQKAAYKAMLVHAYKMRSSSSSLIFILSSESFNQASKRMAYLKQLSKFRSDQIIKIQSTKEKLDTELADLELKKKEKDDLMVEQKSEHTKYISDRENQKKQIENLKGKETQLQQELAAQKKKVKDIQNALNAALNKEILDKKKKKDEKPLTDKEIKEVELSNKGFEADKGKLPWPVSKGEITKGYGKQAHPVHINVYTQNNGVDITTSKGATVRAVYAGEVTSVILIPGAGKAVIIAHGDYRSIYSNLQEAYVTKGAKVETKQDIGYLLANESGTSEVHFEICKITAEGDIVHVNPTYWITQ